MTAEEAVSLRSAAEAEEINFRYFENGNVGISVDETTLLEDVEALLMVFAKAKGAQLSFDVNAEASNVNITFDGGLNRTSDFMAHLVFNQYHAEHEMLRYIKN